MPPNRQRSIDKYRRNAARYDHGGARLARSRARAIALLRLEPGFVVLDVGCGTGLSFALLENGIGPEGRIIGIEQSPDMLRNAEERVRQNGWANVTLIHSPAEEAAIPQIADAVLFSFVHDILQTPGALENVFQHVKPGGRVAAAGTKWAPWWLMPLNAYVWWYIVRTAMTTREGLGRPWRNLLRFAPDLRVEQSSLGIQYVAFGKVGLKRQPERRA